MNFGSSAGTKELQSRSPPCAPPWRTEEHRKAHGFSRSEGSQGGFFRIGLRNRAARSRWKALYSSTSRCFTYHDL